MSGSRQSPGLLLCDICDGTVWEDENQNDPILQVIAYYDDVSMTNPLMSRSKKYKIGKSQGVVLAMHV